MRGAVLIFLLCQFVPSLRPSGGLMTVTISGDSDEFTTQANKLDEIVDSYDGFEVDTAGTDANSTGHVELSQNLPEFAAFVTQAVEALAGNAKLTANALRGVNQDMCTNEDYTNQQISSLELPTFDGSGQAVR